MNMYRKLGWLVTILVLTAMLLPSPVQADAIHNTKGDMESILHAFTTGGRIVKSNNSDTAGYHASPADSFGSNGAIRPFPFWDGEHVCVNDWHILLIGIFDGGDKSYKLQDARDYLNQVEALFVLDGQSLQTTRTSIKRFLNPASFGLETAYGFQVGAIMAPGELGVGPHTLEVEVVDPIYGDAQFDIAFFVDDGDSPTCD